MRDKVKAINILDTLMKEWGDRKGDSYLNVATDLINDLIELFLYECQNNENQGVHDNIHYLIDQAELKGHIKCENP